MRIVLGSCVLLWTIVWVGNAVRPASAGLDLGDASLSLVALLAALAVELRAAQTRRIRGGRLSRVTAAALGVLSLAAALGDRLEVGGAIALAALLAATRDPAPRPEGERRHRALCSLLAGAVGITLLAILWPHQRIEVPHRGLLEPGLSSARVPAFLLLSVLALVVSLRRRSGER